ncbi:50S ribosomal protein L3 [Candidatus Nomurabacteria bacterium]|uniref:Large ribosomal subunit protein uL3 n=1 Tax=candidate division WWE3 bacterium TaxID=2053526 RepID=A0A955IWI2_UNCKA|nr:50S ribosomal protein L3 [candidate division WWE3 bacterium]MCB9823784.1 50S ribosomal protein L3 [Candidatus Nomurabacteria bacterium]MCB9826810.1 50S ribosomal protein L3 [Candidatus Nomurabacteria bacterium]MCB9827579.1 50S ribosomal protein L3 [Candidatus Nomurabacteria bacterium]HXK52938.1 50S ribosomal protein L3 [bacterium]
MQDYKNWNKLKGKKLNMSQVFTPEGKVIPVTYVSLESALDSSVLNNEVVISSISKGKGFTGVMKKWNFKGAQATRGQSDKARSGGSIGAQTPSKVFKGKKMAGNQGNKQVTLKGLRIVDINNETKIIALTGPVPGARNADITIYIDLPQQGTVVEEVQNAN